MPALPFGDGWPAGVQSQGRALGVEIGSVGLNCPLCVQLGRFPSPAANPGGGEPRSRSAGQGGGVLPHGAPAVPALARRGGEAAAAQPVPAQPGSSVRHAAQNKPFLSAFGEKFDPRLCKTQQRDSCALLASRSKRSGETRLWQCHFPGCATLPAPPPCAGTGLCVAFNASSWLPTLLLGSVG